MTVSTHSATRIILATPRAIFRAFIDPEALMNWRAPTGKTVSIGDFDPRPGGGYRLTLTHGDPVGAPGRTEVSSQVVIARFLELDPDVRIVEAISCGSGDQDPAWTMTFTTTMAAVTGGTKVSFVAENAPYGISDDDHRKTMEASLKNLANLLE